MKGRVWFSEIGFGHSTERWYGNSDNETYSFQILLCSCDGDIKHELYLQKLLQCILDYHINFKVTKYMTLQVWFLGNVLNYFYTAVMVFLELTITLLPTLQIPYSCYCQYIMAWQSIIADRANNVNVASLSMWIDYLLHDLCIIKWLTKNSIEFLNIIVPKCIGPGTLAERTSRPSTSPCCIIVVISGVPEYRQCWVWLCCMKNTGTGENSNGCSLLNKWTFLTQPVKVDQLKRHSACLDAMWD